MNVVDKEVVVFEHTQRTHIGNDTQHKPRFSRLARALFYLDTRKIIKDDSAAQYNNILRYEGHIKITTGNKQQCYTTLLILQPEVQKRNQDEKNNELERVKGHCIPNIK